MTAELVTTPTTYGAAAASNMQTNSGVGSGPVNQTSIPIPVDMTKLPAGATIQVNPMAIFGQLPLVVLATPSTPPAGADPALTIFENRVLNALNAILTRLQLPNV